MKFAIPLLLPSIFLNRSPLLNLTDNSHTPPKVYVCFTLSNACLPQSLRSWHPLKPGKWEIKKIKPTKNYREERDLGKSPCKRNEQEIRDSRSDNTDCKKTHRPDVRDGRKMKKRTASRWHLLIIPASSFRFSWFLHGRWNILTTLCEGGKAGYQGAEAIKKIEDPRLVRMERQKEDRGSKARLVEEEAGSKREEATMIIRAAGDTSSHEGI